MDGASGPEGTAAAARSLLDLQNPDGGWGARRGGPSTTEATSLAILALPRSPPQKAAGAGLAWLRERQRPDGAWPPSDQVPLSSWMTPLAVLALSLSGSERGRALRGAQWVLAQEGRGYSWITKLFFRLFPEREAIELDPDLKGWPWMPDTFSWIEPTAYSLIALKTLRSDLPSEPAASRILQGERMILDRMCPGGGWNYGNSVVLGEELWPYPDTTALALIALQDVPDRKEIRTSLEALQRMLAENDSGLAVALATLCFRLYRRDVAALRQRLERSFGTLVAQGETRAIALSVLALHEPENPFQFDHRARS